MVPAKIKVEIDSDDAGIDLKKMFMSI